MIKSLCRAYGGGWRAGKAQQPLICWPDGTKTLGQPVNPYKGRWQGLQRFFWDEGWQSGIKERINNYVKG